MGIRLRPLAAVGQTLVALVVARSAARIPLSGPSYQWAFARAAPDRPVILFVQAVPAIARAILIGLRPGRAAARSGGEMAELGHPRACEEVLTVRRELAGQVVRALQDAGLPALRADAPDAPGRPGPVVMVDADAEMGSAAVSVSWTPGPGMARAAAEAFLAGDVEAPAVRRFATASTRMQGELIRILLAAGFLATWENDDMDPDHVQVFGRKSDLPPALRPTFVPPAR
ncbi:hypothetical protein ACFV0H_30580 [Streptomyces erythrochromogenes]|uniref:hypothetical protein n=1 Tax=Streptomyces erythrochromogenes TaxID=285574 RepID=UPI0004CCE944|nr:hypothetical protein [Streptomyces erythrochromogenes]